MPQKKLQTNLMKTVVIKELVKNQDAVAQVQ